MHRRAFLSTLLGLTVAVSAGGQAPELPKLAAASNPSAHKFSGPFTHANLTMFLIHGTGTAHSTKVVTLKEAMERNLVEVHETSNVNLLSIENKSTEFEIFIMAGDVVKGGKQDRAIAFDIVVPPKSGAVALPSFCVEAGRWRKRGAEDAGKFACSDNQVVGRGLKIAVNDARQQGEVWKEVAVAQKKLSDNVGRNVQAAASPTSLQLCLEDKDLQAKIGAYEKNLTGCTAGKSDVIGVAVVVNGAVSSVDVFGSAELFGKLWPKLLKSAATEALADLKADLKFKECTVDKVESFMADAAKGESKEVSLVRQGNSAGRNQVNAAPNRASGAQSGANAPQQSQVASGRQSNAQVENSPPATTNYRCKITQVASAKIVMIEARDNERPTVVWHRSYIAK